MSVENSPLFLSEKRLQTPMLFTIGQPPFETCTYYEELNCEKHCHVQIKTSQL
jgi:hypothetical protein